MVAKIDIDYCRVGKCAQLMGRMSGDGLELHSMSCLGGSCGDCQRNYIVEVTYNGQTERFQESTVRELMDALKRRKGVDLQPYIKQRGQFVSRNGRREKF